MFNSCFHNGVSFISDSDHLVIFHLSSNTFERHSLNSDTRLELEKLLFGKLESDISAILSVLDFRRNLLT